MALALAVGETPGNQLLLLGIETSCDDSCAAVVASDGQVRSNVVSSQARLHDRYGGVVPEVASRHHLELINAVVDDALDRAGVTFDEIGTVAVTRGPGLIGALLVGLATGKSLAAAQRKPFVAVDHLCGHVAANYLGAEPLEPPFLCLIASGGHTLLASVEDRSGYRVLGQTRDDAAGEALDKAARMLGLGYPGGAEIDRLARAGDAAAFDFPVGMRDSGDLDFSFSGLKTALVYAVRSLGPDGTAERLADLAASYQRAVVDALIVKLELALDLTAARSLALGGGVAANSRLRAEVTRICERRGARLKIPPPELCTDNAAMIASAARYLPAVPYPEFLGFDAFARTAA